MTTTTYVSIDVMALVMIHRMDAVISTLEAVLVRELEEMYK